MKKNATFIFILFLSLFSYKNNKAQSTEDIIRKHIEVIGGEANWAKIKTIVIEGSINNEDGLTLVTKSILKDKCFRSDMIIRKRDASLPDRKYYIVLNGEEGWKYLPGDRNNTIYTLYESEINELKEELDYEDPFIKYEEKGREINMVGIEFFDNVDHYKFSIQYKNGKKEFCYMNSTTFLIVKTVLLDSDIENIKEYKNYEKLPEGILMAKQVTSSIGELIITSIKINPVIAESFFKPSDKNGYYKR